MGLRGRKLPQSCSAEEGKIRNFCSFHWHNEGKGTPNRRSPSTSHPLTAIFSWLTLGLSLIQVLHLKVLPLQRPGSGTLAACMMGNIPHPLDLWDHAEHKDQLKLSAKGAAKGGWKATAPMPALFVAASWKVHCCQQGGWTLWGGGPVISQELLPRLSLPPGSRRGRKASPQGLAAWPSFPAPPLYSRLPLQHWFSISLAQLCWGHQQ